MIYILSKKLKTSVKDVNFNLGDELLALFISSSFIKNHCSFEIYLLFNLFNKSFSPFLPGLFRGLILFAISFATLAPSCLLVPITPVGPLDTHPTVYNLS